jgi:hypothetical protein
MIVVDTKTFHFTYFDGIHPFYNTDDAEGFGDALLAMVTDLQKKGGVVSMNRLGDLLNKELVRAQLEEARITPELCRTVRSWVEGLGARGDITAEVGSALPHIHN